MHHVKEPKVHICDRVPVPKSVTISGLDVTVGLNQCLPLLHHGPQLVSGQPHSVEVGQAVLALKGTLLSD